MLYFRASWLQKGSFCDIAKSCQISLALRNIYYQNPDLFKSQSVVDDMVDNLAFTLGVGREDLNIVGILHSISSTESSDHNRRFR